MGKKDDPALPSPARVAQARELADDAAHGLARRMPALSAHQVITPKQIAALLIIVVALTVFALVAPSAAWTVLVVVTTATFLAGMLFRAGLAFIGGAPVKDAPASLKHLPVYTILVPLFREANVLPRLARALLLLDYPGIR